MPVTALAVLVVLAAVALEARVRPRERLRGWPWFAGWTLAGALGAFAAVSFAVGLFVLPAALAAIVVVSRFAGWPESLGLVAGIGLVAALIGGLSVGAGAGPDPVPWLAAGVGLAGAAALAYVAARSPRDG